MLYTNSPGSSFYIYTCITTQQLPSAIRQDGTALTICKPDRPQNPQVPLEDEKKSCCTEAGPPCQAIPTRCAALNGHKMGHESESSPLAHRLDGCPAAPSQPAAGARAELPRVPHSGILTSGRRLGRPAFWLSWQVLLLLSCHRSMTATVYHYHTARLLRSRSRFRMACPQ